MEKARGDAVAMTRRGRVQGGQRRIQNQPETEVRRVLKNISWRTGGRASGSLAASLDAVRGIKKKLQGKDPQAPTDAS